MATVVCGCSSLRHETPHATINDVAVRQEINTGYQLVAVDGKPVERCRSHIQTMVPYAIVAPGHHTLTLEPESGSDNKKTLIQVNVEEGKRYRFSRRENGVALVEDVD
jgi:hypothetical protein